MSKTRVTVNVREGRLVGTVEKGYRGHYVAFKGIPYAMPPVGDLRFKDPVPAKPWSGARDASTHGNKCAQSDFLTGNVVGSEDCLYLNVYTTDVDPSEKRAVMVWIHGGGFYAGTGDALFYGPENIVPKDVVLVTLNYRLGVLGFLNLGDEVATGNQGLKDIAMALRWVQDNISKFGGDPENVTIFGGSAGGVAVHFLALSPYAEGLFHKVISQSGLATHRCFWSEKAFAVNKGFDLAKKLGKVTTDPKVVYEFLKTVDVKTLVTAHVSFHTKECFRKLIIPFTPSMDSESPNPFFPEHLSEYLLRGVKVPFIVGNTAAEGVIFVNSNVTTQKTKEELKFIDADFSHVLSPHVLATIADIPMEVEELRTLYFGDKTVSKETLLNLADFYTDALFYRGTMEVADVQAKLNSGTTYLYRFSYESKTRSIYKVIMDISLPGAVHGEETPYLFHYHIMEKLGLPLPKPNSEEYRMIDYMTQLWTDFAKTGNPTPNITKLTPVKWTPLKSGDTYDYLDININTEVKAFIKGKERWDWESKKRQLS